MEDVTRWLNRISQLRSIEDLPDYFNQRNIYVSGRSTTRVPSGSSDVVVGDRQGDQVVAVDGSYLYILVSVSGSLAWSRVALTTVW